MGIDAALLNGPCMLQAMTYLYILWLVLGGPDHRVCEFGPNGMVEQG